MLRGTGPGGLRGVRAHREDGLWRPLLDVWRDELEGYARVRGLGWREDPTNEVLGYARNALRHRIIPAAEALVAPGARRSLVRFAEQAAFDEEGWESLVPELLTSLDVVRRPDGVRLDREALLAHHPAVRARLLRALTMELDLVPDARHTARALDFAESGESGRSLELGGGVVLRRELHRLALVRPPEDDPPADRPLTIGGLEPGRGEALLGGRTVRVAWGDGVAMPGAAVERFAGGALRFPLHLRAWEDGDRMRTRNGVRKLKRIFLEARVPAPERRRSPVLTDAEGEVLWIPGVARTWARSMAPGKGGGDVLSIGVS
jgi:tRNA(Ile)-lysidine synthase